MPTATFLNVPPEKQERLMDAASRGKGNGLNFSSNEISAVLEVLKMGKSPQEAAKIDRIVSLMRMIR